jgi:hypothetical protein
MSLFRKKTYPDSFKKLYPKCLDSSRLHFIGSDYLYYPCCFTRVGEGRQHFLDLIDGNVDDLDIRKNTKEKILKSKSWKKLIRSFSKKPISTCLEMCPKSTKPTKEFDGRNGFRIY